MKTLHLTIKKQYFDQIVSGEKKEEYRLIKPYWVKRLIDKSYDKIVFRNGYSSDAPTHCVQYLGYDIKNITHDFFGGEQISVFVIKIGETINQS